MSTRTTAVVVFLMAVGSAAPARGQLAPAAFADYAAAHAASTHHSPAHPATAYSPAPAAFADVVRTRPAFPPVDAVLGKRLNLPSEAGIGRSVSAAQVRQRLLFRGGEFSTFSHRSRHLAARLETPVQMDSLDRQTEDRWFALDKAKHVTFSFLWTLSTQYVVVNKGRISEQHALPLSISSGAAIGVSKEYYDLTVGPTEYFSTKDLVADAVGILLAVGVILL